MIESSLQYLTCFSKSQQFNLFVQNYKFFQTFTFISKFKILILRVLWKPYIMQEHFLKNRGKLLKNIKEENLRSLFNSKKNCRLIIIFYNFVLETLKTVYQSVNSFNLKKVSYNLEVELSSKGKSSPYDY